LRRLLYYGPKQHYTFDVRSHFFNHAT
jgi:hypothetical protein